MKIDDIVMSEYGNTAGLVVMKNNRAVYENYYNGCTNESRVHIYSVTKSIISILTGIALDKGIISSVNQKVLEFFPDYRIKKREKTIQEITVKNILTMTAPYKYKRTGPYIKYFTSGDMLNFSLDLLGGKDQPGEFRYAPLIGPDILSGIITVSTGQSVLDFADKNLFAPLGITVEKSLRFNTKEEQLAFNKSTDISGWHADKAGLNTAGWGLSLSAADMAKIGQLCLDCGKWKDEQVVSAEWIQECMDEHSRWAGQNLSYGYLWWIIDQDQEAFAAMGDGGNIIYFNRKKNLVAASTALFVRNAKDRIKLIREHIEPVF